MKLLYSSSSIAGGGRGPALLLLLLLLVVAVSTTIANANANANANNPRHLNGDFIKAMNEIHARKEAEERQTALMERLLQDAKPITEAFTTNNNNNGNGKRNLANNNNNGYNYNYGYNNYYNNNQNNNNYNNNNQNNNNYNNNNYNNNNNNQNNNNNNNNQQQEAQQDDDTFRDYGGLNLTQYALKYLGCQNIHTFNDDLADDEDSTTVLAMDRFVVFRLCPKKQCSNYHEYGCAYNYGEYMIPMEDYLQLMQAYHIQQYQEYCQTCHQCMTQTGNFANNNDDDGGGNDDGNGNGNNNNNNNNQRHLNNDNGNNNNGGGGQYANYYYNKNGNYYNRNFGNNNNNGNGNNGNNNNNNYNNGNNNNNNNGNGNNNYNMYAQQDDDQVQNNNYNNYNYNDDNVANDDGNANDDAAAAAAGDDDAYASSKNGNTTSYRCAYADVCETYMEACAGMDTDDNAFAQSDAYSAYFQCSEFNVGGSVSYLGPHCRSDGFTIGIGIYQDENCYTYIGDVVDMQQATGQTFNDDYLSPYYPQQCISCTASVRKNILVLLFVLSSVECIGLFLPFFHQYTYLPPTYLPTYTFLRLSNYRKATIFSQTTK